MPSFAECFLGEGNVDVVEAMRVLRDSGFDGVVIDDHVPLLDGDPAIIPGMVKSEYAYHGRAYELGYLQGLLAAVLARRPSSLSLRRAAASPSKPMHRPVPANGTARSSV